MELRFKIEVFTLSTKRLLSKLTRLGAPRKVCLVRGPQNPKEGRETDPRSKKESYSGHDKKGTKNVENLLKFLISTAYNNMYRQLR